MKRTRRVIIGIGSNTADRHAMMHQAVAFLVTVLDRTVVSEIYPTEPEGQACHPYLNAVIMGETDLEREALCKILKSYEQANGRTDSGKLQDIVPIDLDLVVDGDEVLRPEDFKRQYFTIGYNRIIK